jgi:hypothetical protein
MPLKETFMQNEFEKQVQQKMEELKLVPSEPVWQKVEMQIRKKKDRRRLIFWIPLLSLLLGSGLWFGIDQYSNHTAYNKKNSDKLNHQTQKQNPVTQPKQTITKKIINESQEENLKTLLPVSPAKKKTTKTVTTEDVSFDVTSIQKKFVAKSELRKESPVAEQDKKPSTKNEETIFSETPTKVAEKLIEPEKENQQASPKTTDSVITNVSTNEKMDSFVEIEKKVEVGVLKIDSLKNDSTSVKTPTIKIYGASKWRLAFAISAGVSGSGKLDVFNGFLSENKSMDYSSAPTAGGGSQNGGTLYYPPSEIKKGFSFTVKAGIKKQLNRRTSVSTGLQYNYYSNSISVGNRVAQNAMFGNYSVAQYFSNNRIIYNSTSWQSYHNHYHFISLPFDWDWQLFRKRPLNLSAGLSLQYLAGTNGLIFDYNRQAYFHNKNAFNTVQLFSNLGLNYFPPTKKTSIAIGPELQYGISRLEKDNSNHHLFMYGLKAQLQLK